MNTSVSVSSVTKDCSVFNQVKVVHSLNVGKTHLKISFAVQNLVSLIPVKKNQDDVD